MEFSLLLVLGLLAQGGHTAKPNLELVFDEKSPPCRDLFRHVCVDTGEMRKLRVRKEQGLLEDVVKVLRKHNVEDRIYSTVWTAMKKEWNLSKEENKKCRFKKIDVDEKDFLNGTEYKIGKAFGKMLFYGRFGDKQEVRVGFAQGSSNVVAVTEIGKSFIGKPCPFNEIDNEFVRGILEDFYGELPDGLRKLRHYVFIYHNLKANHFKKVILGPTIWETKMNALKKMFMSSNRMIKIERYKAIFRSETFAGYGNVLLAHTLYTYKAELNPAVADELTGLAKRVMKEIVDNVAKSTWISPADRERITGYLKENKIIIGIEKKYRNLDLLKHMMEVYHAEFEKVKPEDECQMEMLSRAHGIARHKLIYSGVGSVASFSIREQNDGSLFNDNAFHIGNTVHVLPGLIHILNDYRLSSGFKYGHIVCVIGHEIFHGLGITEERAFKHLTGVMETRTFKEGRQCLLDFYGEKQFCTQSGRCPDASRKIDEGFPDIESARVVFPLLQKALQQHYSSLKKRTTNNSERLPLFNWRPPGFTEEQVLMSNANSLTQEQWFFIGIQAFHCVFRHTEENFLKYAHPRPHIRAHAVAQQMAQFTRAFGCKKGDRNYMADRQWAPCDIKCIPYCIHYRIYNRIRNRILYFIHNGIYNSICSRIYNAPPDHNHTI
ncbi:hypothetical protein QR680_010303 [Steinernema hermaphroditum]|uniref:Peptidase M13 C-terminal domain-containing protein n=1 Tax=Steinernema hermaphroditum TaxID=289476 RepID=A0AA39IR53_9BILA|nr:hypothetical protein QR680_010303 [Steinernema hermaphroditum]